MSRGQNTVGFRVDMSGLDAYLDQLGDAVEEAVTPACAAVAKVYYDAARSYAPVSEKAHFFYGTNKKYGPFQPGTLRSSIYRVLSKDNSGPGFTQYHISFNYEKAPYAFMVEYGTSNAPAHSFIRRAMNNASVQKEALDAGERVLMQYIDKAAA